MRIDLDAVRRELAVREARAWPLARFVREAWPQLEPETELVWGKYLDGMCACLEAVSDGRIKRLVINIPPGHMKSLLVSVFWPAWWWLRRPGLRLLSATYQEELTLRDARRTRDLVDSDWYAETFRPDWRFVGDQNAKRYFENTARGYRMSVSTGAGTTGKRGDGILIDDPMSREMAESDVKRQSANDYVTKTLPTRVNSLRDAFMVLVMQRLHMEDTSGVVLQSGKWQHLCLPAEYDPELHSAVYDDHGELVWEDWRTDPGEVLFPERYGIEELEELKSPAQLGSRGYANEYGQRPSPAEGGIIKLAWTKNRYDELERDCYRKGRWTMSVDPKAGSKDPKSAFAVVQVWCQLGANHYLVDQVRGRWDIAETMRAIEAMAKKWPQVKRKLIEDAADGKGIRVILGQKVPGIILVKPLGGDKETKLEACAWVWESGNVWLPVEFPSADVNSTVDGYVGEITKVPANPYWDQADATHIYLNDVAPKPKPFKPGTVKPKPGTASRLKELRKASKRRR